MWRSRRNGPRLCGALQNRRQVLLRRARYLEACLMADFKTATVPCFSCDHPNQIRYEVGVKPQRFICIACGKKGVKSPDPEPLQLTDGTTPTKPYALSQNDRTFLKCQRIQVEE